MKRRKELFLAFAVVVFFAGCGNEEEKPVTDHPIRITPAMTRATDTAFEAGDEIGLNITINSEIHADNHQLVHNGDHFVSSELKWYEEEKKGKFIAYYPYEFELNPREFYIPADQRGEGYAQADFMVANKDGVTPQVTGVALTFKHIMSRIDLNVDNWSDVEIEKIVLGGSRVMCAISLDGGYTAVPGGSTVGEIIMHELGDDKYRAAIIPQKAPLTITIYHSEGKTEKTMNSTTFNGGSYYTIDLTFSGEFDITDVEITADDEIVDWEEGENVEEK